MDLITHELRTEHWKGIIAQCQARPDGVSAKQWLKDKQVKEKAYYYWLRKFRKQAYEVIRNESPVAEAAANEVSFVELQNVIEPSDIPVEAPSKPDAVIAINNVRIELYNSASGPLVRNILEGVKHA